MNPSILPNTEPCSANDFLHWKFVIQVEDWYCSTKDREWSVSILIDNCLYALDQNTSCLTVLFGVLEPDVVPLHHRYCWSEDWEWWVSILIGNGVYAVDQKTSCLTVLLRSAWARCCAPSAPIPLVSRLRVVSVYIDWQWCICSRSEDKLSYRVFVQCLSKMLCPVSTDLVLAKIESGECLYWSIMVYMQSIRRQVVLPCCCVVLEPDVVPLHHRYCYG